MEARFDVQTPHGEVWLWGRVTGRPVVMLITGAFSNFEAFERLQDFLPDTDVLRAHLPGNHCPELPTVSISAFAEAYSCALGALARGRPVVLIGQSTGALVALAMTVPNLRRLLIVEPPLRSDDLWPFLQFRTRGPDDWEKVIWPIFGVGATDLEPRDYRPLLNKLTVPTAALVGGVTLLPERPLEKWPSLVDEQSREALEAHGVEVVVSAAAGHNVAAQDRATFSDFVWRNCAAAFG